MCDNCDAVATATFTILPEPGTGCVALLRDGVELGTFRTQAEAFACGAGYVALSSGSGNVRRSNLPTITLGFEARPRR